MPMWTQNCRILFFIQSWGIQIARNIKAWETLDGDIFDIVPIHFPFTMNDRVEVPRDFWHFF